MKSSPGPESGSRVSVTVSKNLGITVDCLYTCTNEMFRVVNRVISDDSEEFPNIAL